MEPAIVQQLCQLNQRFYAQLADPFARTRANPHPGFFTMLTYLPQPCQSLLDVGCGNGRFGHFLQQHHPFNRYVGVDFTVELLAKGGELLPNATFYQRDISQPGCLEGVGTFDLVVCLAAMHHIPGRDNRTRLLWELGQALRPNGRLIISNWQFMNSQRQRRKLRDWSELGLAAADVDETDHLLTWRHGGFGLRYVAMIDEQETAVMAQATQLHIIDQFRSDGKEENLSLYTVFAHPA